MSRRDFGRLDLFFGDQPDQDRIERLIGDEPGDRALARPQLCALCIAVGIAIGAGLAFGFIYVVITG